jgi:hypothetical protein
MNNRYYDSNNYTTLRSQYKAQADMCNNGVNPIRNPFPAAYIPDVFSCGNGTILPHSWPPSSQPAQCSTPNNIKQGNYTLLKASKHCPVNQ